MSLSMIELLRTWQRRHVLPLAIRFGSFFLILLSFSFGFHAGAQGLGTGGPFSFGSLAVGSSSTPLTFTYPVTSTTTVMSVIITDDGAQNKDFVLLSTTCVGTFQPGDACNATIKFSPLQVGLRKGALSFLESSGVKQIIYLSGVGLGPQIVFSPVTAVATSSVAALSPSTFKTSTSVYDGAGNLFFNDYLNGRILELNSANAASVVASQIGNEHSSMAIDGAGDLYVSSPTQGTVQVIIPGASNTALNTGTSVTLVSPSGVAVDGDGFIYIADSQTSKIARIAPGGANGTYLTLAGLTTPLLNPYGLAVDANNLYIADAGNGRIVAVSLSTGAATAVSASNAFVNNYGVAVDAAGNLVVSNAGGSNIEELTPSGAVFAFIPDTGNTLASTPLGLNLSSATGDIVSSDADLGLVAITRSTGSLTFPTPTKIGFVDSTDGDENLTVQNSGNEAIQFLASDPAFSSTVFTSGPTNTCPVLQAAATPLAVGGTCTYSVGFKPTVIGADDGTLTVKGAGVGTGAAISAFSNLIGTGITPVDTLKVTASPTTTAPGVPVSFTVTALDGTTIITAFTGTVTFTMTDATGTFLSGTSYTFTTTDAGVHTFAAPVGAQFNTPGTFTISAHLGSVVGISNPVVVAFPSQTALTSSVNPVFINNNTTLTATVSSTASAIVATGTITFLNGTTTIGTCTLAAGQCGTPVSFPTAGSFPLTAVYSSDTNFAASTSNTVTQVVTDFTAQPSLISSVNPSFVTQQTTLTATVIAAPGQPGAGTPTGTVTFKDGATVLGTVALTGTTASLPVAFSTAGNHLLTVTYNGDTSFGPATSTPALTQVVNDYTAVATLTSSVNPSFVGQQTTLTATVTAAPGQPGAGTPTGTVTFKDGTTVLGTITLTGGTAGGPVTFTTAGNHNLTVVYSGDTTFNPVTSTPALVQVVNQYLAQAALTSSINPSFVNQQTTLTATITAVAGQTGSITPTGTVTFKDGGASIGTAPLTNGVATLPIGFTPSGNHFLTVTYNGSTSYATVTSTPALTQVVNQYTSQVVLTSSINPSLLNQQTTLTATVSATPGQTGSGTPTGTVTFKDGTTVLGTVTLVNGAITFPASFSTLGTHNLTAVYNDDTSFSGSTSAILVQVVDSFTSQAALTSSINPSLLNQQTTLTATISATPGQPGAGTPTGTVTFMNGTTVLGTATLTAGAATFPASFATAGSYPLTVVYVSNTNSFTGSTSPVLTQVVNDFTAQAALTSSINPSFVNQQTTLTATVSAAAGQPGAGTPTGTVIFMDGAAALGTAPLTAGVATLPISFSTPGNHLLTVVYSGSPSFSAVTSPQLTQVVNDYASQAALTSSVNPSFVNQQTTLTATITAVAGQTGSTTPTGTVTFRDGATTLGTATLTGGVATLPASFSTAGNHLLTVVYGGSTSFSTVTSPQLTQVVNAYASQATLASSVNPSFINQQTTLTATVSAVAGQAGSGTPTGTVTFKDGTTTLGTATLTGGVATLPASFTTPGTHSLTVVYGGDTSFLTTTSPVLTQVVNGLVSQVTLTSSANPAFINNAVILTATIAASAGQGTAPAPGGTVTFLYGTTSLGSAAVVNGQATFATTFSFVGNYALTAVYSGDLNFLTATSPVLTQVVGDFTIAVASGTTPTETVLGGSSTTYTFTLTPIGGSTFAGPISFGISGFPLGTVATFSPATLASGVTGANVTLTVKPPTAVQARLDPGKNQLRPRTAARYAPVVLALLMLPFAAFRRRRRPAALFLWVLLCASAIGLTGCVSDSSSGYYGNTPQTYTLSVSGTSGTLTHATTVTLTVQ